jgi:predicted RNase H-like nuclease (RuvC/YqgF family)
MNVINYHTFFNLKMIKMTKEELTNQIEILKNEISKLQNNLSEVVEQLNCEILKENLNELHNIKKTLRLMYDNPLIEKYCCESSDINNNAHYLINKLIILLANSITSLEEEIEGCQGLPY